MYVVIFIQSITIPLTEPESVVVEDGVEVSDEEEDEEEEDVSEFNTLFRLMRSEKTLGDPNQTPQGLNTPEPENEEGLLNEGPIRVRNIEDLEVLAEDVDPRPIAAPSLPQTAVGEATSEPPNKKRREIDLKEVLTKDAKVVKVPFLPTVVEEEVSSILNEV